MRVYVERPRMEHGARQMARRGGNHQIRGMKNLELSDAETVALIDALKRAIVTDRYPLSPRVRMLAGILNKLRPEPARPAAAPEPRMFAPPSKGRYRRRR